MPGTWARYLICAAIALLAGSNALSADSHPQVNEVSPVDIMEDFRGDDLLVTPAGMIVAGWSPQSSSKPFVAMFSHDFSQLLWRTETPLGNGSILMSLVFADDKIFVSGASNQGEETHFAPFIMALDMDGEVQHIWQPEHDPETSTPLWDIVYDPASQLIVGAGETGYRRDTGHVYAVALDTSLSKQWHKTVAVAEHKSAVYAAAMQNGRLLMAGSVSTKTGEEDETVGYPLLLVLSPTGEKLEQHIRDEQAGHNYHWIQADARNVYTGGYGPVAEDPNQSTLDIFSPDLKLSHELTFGSSKSDRAIHSTLCGSHIVFSGFTQSYSDTGWRGYIESVNVSSLETTTHVIQHEDRIVAVRNVTCADDRGSAHFIGYRQDAEGKVHMVTGTIEL